MAKKNQRVSVNSSAGAENDTLETFEVLVEAPIRYRNKLNHKICVRGHVDYTVPPKGIIEVSHLDDTLFINNPNLERL